MVIFEAKTDELEQHYLRDFGARPALEWMVQEGIEIERENGKEIQEVSGKTLTRKVDMAPKELAEILHAEFARCFRRKNPKTTQREKKGKE